GGRTHLRITQNLRDSQQWLLSLIQYSRDSRDFWDPTPAATAPSPSPRRASNVSSSAWEPPREPTVSRETSPAQSEESVVGTEIDEKRR
ncbi:hypothetical protein E4U57_001972, partial [Claviceps arundinis]